MSPPRPPRGRHPPTRRSHSPPRFSPPLTAGHPRRTRLPPRPSDTPELALVTLRPVHGLPPCVPALVHQLCERRVTLALPARPVLAWRGFLATSAVARRSAGVVGQVADEIEGAACPPWVRAIVVSSQPRQAGGAGPLQQPSGRPLRASDEGVQKRGAGLPGLDRWAAVWRAAVRPRCQLSAARNGRTSIGFLVAAAAFDAHTRAASRSSARMM